SFYHSGVILDGGDQICVIFSFLLIPLTIFDKRRNHWLPKRNQSQTSCLVGNLSFLLISIQVSFIYLNTAFVKLTRIDEWLDGTALYYFLEGKYYGVNDFFKPLIYPIIESDAVILITWGVILSHLFIAYCLFLDREKRQIYLILGLFLH